MKQLPDTVTAYSKTSVFTEDTIPANLLADHRTKAGGPVSFYVEFHR